MPLTALNCGRYSQNGGLVLRQGTIVAEFASLLRHIDEALRFSLQSSFNLFMAAVRERMKFFAGVTGIDWIVGAVRVSWEGTGTYVADILHIDNAANLPFGRSIAALHDLTSQETAHDSLVGRAFAERLLLDPSDIRSRRDIGSRRDRTVVA
ncbi:hypothetical protein LH31_26255 [Pseudomonas aeruginosa]|nr:hypothetical protein LH31_26255 [Pseudomonas aeruginosa]